MNDKEDKCGLAVEDFFVTWNRLRLEFACCVLPKSSEATEDIKEASASRELERRVLVLETKVAQLERMARK